MFGAGGGSVLHLAFLPQHVWQVTGTFMGVVVIVWMVYILVVGRIFDADWSPRRLRVVALGGLLIGAGFIATAWTVNAEPPCGDCNADHWGGTSGIIGLIAFIGIAVAIQVRNVRDERRHRRQTPRHE
jgi:hypothetical protein